MCSGPFHVCLVSSFLQYDVDSHAFWDMQSHVKLLDALSC